MKPRIRTIKPEFFVHEDLFDLEQETALPVRLAYIGLWCIADREGRFQWRPRALKSLVMPHDVVDFGRVLGELARTKHIIKYDVDGSAYGYIPSFLRHQVINQREARSDLPEPPTHVHARADANGHKQAKTLGAGADAGAAEPPDTGQRTGAHVHARGEGKGTGREGKGREGERAGASAAPGLPPGGLRPSPDQDSEPEPLLERLAAAWQRVVGTELGDPGREQLGKLLEQTELSGDADAVGTFERAAQALAADCAERGKRPVVAWLRTQWDEWAAPVRLGEGDAKREERARAERIAAEARSIDAEIFDGEEMAPPPPRLRRPTQNSTAPAPTESVAAAPPARALTPEQQALRDAKSALKAARDRGAPEHEIVALTNAVRAVERESLNAARLAEGKPPIGSSANGAAEGT